VTAAVAQRPRLFRDSDRPFGRDDAPQRRPGRSGGGRPTTLEQQLERVWEGLAAAKPTSCLVCGSDGQWQRLAAPTHPSGPAAGAGGFRCAGCGSTVA
jgi:hypothetical protein